MLSAKFDMKLFLLLSFSFIIFTIIGTVSHELGHYTVAKSLGYSASISYSYTYWQDLKTDPFTDSLFSKYPNEIKLNKAFPNKEKFDKIENEKFNNAFLITLGGPIQTMLTGTIGLFLLLKQRKKIITKNKINLYQWLCIFLTMFWLRQLANALVWVSYYFINGKFSLHGDEIRTALFLNLSKEIFIFSTAAIAFAILIFIIFKIIPSYKRIAFILAGLFGGIFGYLFWLVWVGPILMP